MTRRLEEALARRYGFDYAVVAGSGCQALLMALHATGLGAGKRVATSTYVCPEVMAVIEAAGAQCLLGDIDDSHLLDPADNALAGADGVVVPAIMGIPADPSAYSGANVRIADWAQYAPPPGSGEAAGWDAAIVSFEATKLLTAGEGGAVLTNSAQIADKLAAQKRIGDGPLKLNLYPFSDLQAALALSQLERLDSMLKRRAKIASRYAAATGRETVANPDRATRYVIEVSDLDACLAAFAEAGIAARRPIDPICHMVSAASRRFTRADMAWERLVSLPCHPSLTDREIELVAGRAKDLL